MRMVVTGREGQVVRSLIERTAGTGIEVICVGRPQLELAGPAAQIQSAIEAAKPDVLVSAAAYTLVDKAEAEPELAFKINRDGPGALAMVSRKLAIPMIHLSTDYVFDGSKSSPYVEDDPTAPTGTYGASKLAGEAAVLAENDNSAVLRTAWVYSPFGANFVKTMLRLAADRSEICVVADQTGNPTSALDIADAIVRVAANLCNGQEREKRGVFHMTSATDASWAGFAEAIFDLSARAGGPSASVKRILTVDYPTAAKRPANSRLNSNKLGLAHGARLPDWHNSLKDVVLRLVQNGARGA